MIHTVDIVVPPYRAEQRIIADTTARIRHIQATRLPQSIISDRILDYFLQAGRDLERLAKHKQMIVHLRPASGGGQ